jgi:hypothetical protein
MMRKGLFLSLFFLLNFFVAICQPVYIGDLNFSTQFSLLNFSNAYTRVIGNVSISTSGVNDLSPLSNIRYISGSLSISDTNIPNLNGLHNIDTIGGYVDIRNNNTIVNLNASMNLKRVFGPMSILFNENLQQISGFTNLKAVGNQFRIIYNRSLTSTTGFSQLDSIYGSFALSNNNVLNNISGFGSLNYVESDFDITFCNALQNLNAFSSLPFLGGNLVVAYNQQLNDISIFSYLDTLSGSITIEDNDVLLSIQGLHNIKTTAGVTISNNNVLTQINLDSLTSTASLIINACPAVPDLLKLKKLKKIYSNLSISSMNLANLRGLDNLIYIKNNLQIDNCPNLTHTVYNVNQPWRDSMHLENLVIVGSLQFVNNPNLNLCCFITNLYRRNGISANHITLLNNGSQCSDFVDMLTIYCANSDSDDIINAIDNCDFISNPLQLDADSNGIGDDCEVGNASVVSKVEVQQSDLYIKERYKGIIMKDGSGICYKIQMGGNGAMNIIRLANCP